DLGDLIKATLTLGRLGQRSARPFGFPAAAVARPFLLWEALGRSWLDANFRGPEAAEKRLRAVEAESPDAVLLLVRSMFRLQMVLRRLKKADRQETIASLREAADLAHRASTAPTLLPRAPYRYLGLFLAAAADGWLVGGFGDGGAERARRLRDNLR